MTAGTKADGGETESPERSSKLRNILIMFIVFKILMSYDSGAFSAVLATDGGITDELDLTTSQQGALGSSVFLGNMIGCAVAGPTFSQHSAKATLGMSLIMHSVCTFLFSVSSAYEASMVFRFFIGVTLAFIVVYSPIWVDEFAPKKKGTTWMALINAGVPVGIMIGFLVGGLLPTNTGLSWRWSFHIKTLLMIPLTIVVYNLEPQNLETRKEDEPPVLTSCDETAKKVWGVVHSLIKNPLFMCNMLGLSALYFVVTALQTFVTPYLRAAPFNASMNTIVVGFGISVVTAPVLGVITGGVLLDRIGGYHGNLVRASVFETSWSFVAVILSIACCFVHTTGTFLLLIWLVMFCGGAIVAPGTCLIMACLPESLRPAASSFANLAFNLLGYFLGPLVCGFVADEAGDLAWGIRMTLASSLFGFIPMVAGVWYAKKQQAEKQASVAGVVGLEMEPSGPMEPSSSAPTKQEEIDGEDLEPLDISSLTPPNRSLSRPPQNEQPRDFKLSPAKIAQS